MRYSSVACRNCGVVFEKNTYNQIFCSKDCVVEYNLTENENKNIGQFLVFMRDDFRCCYCGKSSIDDGVHLAIDHIIPRSAGGNNSMYNVVTSCDICNISKSNRILSRDVILRILKRNIKKNRGISSAKRNEIKQLLNNRFADAANNKSTIKILSDTYK